ncbi:hypothetical protein [Amycolatopsis silviterrae]|uniref:Uncharacterized protein n=1 Tax=Amycolatopsis silviterrae TaxID=1656914 RepID=A0ABW5H7L9_9PSEU
MGKMAGRLAVAALALAGMTAAAPVATAATVPAAPHSVLGCVEYAVTEGEADLDIAFPACSQGSLLDCYRIFRDEYGRQAWALEACKLRGQ